MKSVDGVDTDGFTDDFYGKKGILRRTIGTTMNLFKDFK